MFEIYIDRAGQYRFRLKGKNGKITAHATEGYDEKNQVKDIISDVLTQTKFTAEFRYNKANKPYIVFVSQDDSLGDVARTEAFYNKSNANRALKKIIIMLADFRTKVVDLTDEAEMAPLLNDYSYDEEN